MAFNVGGLSISWQNRNLPNHDVWMIVTNTIIIGTGIVAIFLAPMPDTWIAHTTREYILTVASGLGALMKAVEKGTTNVNFTTPVKNDTPTR